MAPDPAEIDRLLAQIDRLLAQIDEANEQKDCKRVANPTCAGEVG